MNRETGTPRKLIRIMGYDPLYESFYNSRILEKVRWDAKEDIETVKNAVQTIYSDKYLLSKIEKHGRGLR